MSESLPFQLLANAVLTLHVALVLFVVGGAVIVIIGNFLKWRWVNTLWFRLAHLVAIIVVVAEAWLGIVCPLTSVEMWLRTKAHATTYTGSFVEYWLARILYYEAPAWVFTTGYTLFGLIVVAIWWYYPPKANQRTDQKTDV